MNNQSILQDIRNIGLAVELISLGARLQMVEAETNLSRGKLTKLYKEIHGCSPPKGLLPFSADWFMHWEQNIHASVFCNIWRFIQSTGLCSKIETIVKAYRLYLEHVPSMDDSPLLSFTRAWTLIRFLDADVLGSTHCTQCRGLFVSHAFQPKGIFICSLCAPPSRATKISQEIGFTKEREEEVVYSGQFFSAHVGFARKVDVSHHYIAR
ncbi:transcriptional regulator FlhC [Citrobacter sp. NCU1]|uniref:flagellar transcriptional regulator FlhC n=1 Tax=Citrobacter sp. NCU1 TaxID=2026683 RepID=UPI0013920B6D|nr:flagellar transcriptional regulator FlhC [Citrobacter sp. NCU1]NDO81125.1 transcriptional regulator FlhC [Citrobacter sp. NCU1]